MATKSWFVFVIVLSTPPSENCGIKFFVILLSNSSGGRYDKQAPNQMLYACLRLIANDIGDEFK
jgi:hypothetical protein